MRIQEQFHLLVRLDQLIRLKATGTPAMLAQRFNVSERTVYYLIVRLKDLGAPVEYCRERESYYYSEGIGFQLKIIQV